MTGNQHPIRRCDTCEFWARGDQWNTGMDKDRHPDDRIGACRRNAPRPTVGDHEYALVRLISMIAWTHATDEEKKSEFDNESAPLKTCSWPGTSGSDWCGEWQKREHESKGMDW